MAQGIVVYNIPNEISKILFDEFVIETMPGGFKQIVPREYTLGEVSICPYKSYWYRRFILEDVKDKSVGNRTLMFDVQKTFILDGERKRVISSYFYELLRTANIVTDVETKKLINEKHKVWLTSGWTMIHENEKKVLKIESVRPASFYKIKNNPDEIPIFHKRMANAETIINRLNRYKLIYINSLDFSMVEYDFDVDMKLWKNIVFNTIVLFLDEYHNILKENEIKELIGETDFIPEQYRIQKGSGEEWACEKCVVRILGKCVGPMEVKK